MTADGTQDTFFISSCGSTTSRKDLYSDIWKRYNPLMNNRDYSAVAVIICTLETSESNLISYNVS